MLEVAKEFKQQGLYPIPCEVSLKSCDVFAKWKDAPNDPIGDWKNLFQSQTGIGIKLGTSSGMLYVVDVDTKHDSTGQLKQLSLEGMKHLLPEIYDDFYIEETRSGGLHIFFFMAGEPISKFVPARTMDVDKSGKQSKFALVEVLGEGQMVFTHPTPGYRILQGSIEEIPTINEEQYKQLIEIFRSFNELPDEDLQTKPVELPPLNPADLRPGSIFNATVEPSKFIDFMVQDGWSIVKKIGEVYWLRRPGKERGISATFNHDGRRLLYVFSSSTEFDTHHPDGSMKGWTPFAVLAKVQFGGDYKKATAFLVSKGYVNDEEWGDIEPIEQAKAEPFKMEELLPPGADDFKNYINAIAESYQVPPEMAALPALSMISLAISGAVNLRVNGDWIEDAPLWSMIVAQASDRKSPVFAEIHRPEKSYFSEFAKVNKNSLLAIKRQRKGLEKRMLVLDEKYEKALAKFEETDELEEAIEKAQEELDATSPITELPDLLQSDITPEALVGQLEKNGEVAGIFSSEADPIMVALGLYSDKPNFSIYLKGYSVETYLYNRKNSGQIRIEDPRIVMSIMLQHEPMNLMATNRSARDRGFLARFLYAIPTTKVGGRKNDTEEVSQELRDWWEALIHSLFALPHRKQIHINTEESKLEVYSGEVRTMELSPEAKERLWEERTKNEALLAPGEELDDGTGWGGKLMGNICRLAMAMHFATQKKGTIIDRETMDYACRWVEPLMEHYHCAVNSGGRDGIDKKVVTYIKRMAKKQIYKEITIKRLFDEMRSRGQSREDHEPIWGRMIQLGYAKIEKKIAEGGKRASDHLVLHPRIMEVVK